MTTHGRDWDSELDGPIIFDKSAYGRQGVFNGTADEGKSTQDVNSLKGNAIRENQQEIMDLCWAQMVLA